MRPVSARPQSEVQVLREQVDTDACLLSPHAQEFVPNQGEQRPAHAEATVTDLVAGLALLQTPMPEPPVFDGDAMKYLERKATYDALIHHRGIANHEVMQYLKKYLSGDARSAVEGHFLLLI
jgi:hypothetical protein